MKVALLSNFTLTGLDKYLRAAAKKYGIDIDFYVGEYGQWQQEILGKKLYDSAPDIVFVILDILAMQGDSGADYGNATADVFSKKKQGILEDVIQYIDKLAQKTTAKVVVSNAVQPFVDEINRELAEQYKDNKQVFVFDFDGWLGLIGKLQFWYDKYRYLGDMRLSPKAFPILADELMFYLVPLAGKTKKCLVLDLDNTLWGGIIGEDGLGGIKLSPAGEGAPFYYFQRFIKGLKERGTILAVNSCNNENDVKEVFAKHEHMILKEDDFAATRINWNNKAQNMEELAQELNIGLDSMVFIDDDPHNCELIRQTAPEVDVIDLPEDPAEYIKILLTYRGFSSFIITDEDRQRAKMYEQEKKRRQFKEEIFDLDSFLKGLQLSVIIQPVSDVQIPRAAQLTQKTNQFNLTTRRYQEEDVKNMIRAGAQAWELTVRDKFGEYGTVGLIIVKDAAEQWEIDTLLLSCRVLGKRVEEEFFGHVLDQLKKQNPKKIVGCYIPTEKNQQVKDFYQTFGFKKRQSGQADIWEHNLRAFKLTPLAFINTIIK